MYLEVSKHDNVHSRYILLSFLCDKGVYFYNFWIHSPIMHTFYFQQLYLRKIMKFVLGELFQNGAFWLVFNLLLICSFIIKNKQNFEFLYSFVLLLKSKKKFELNWKGCIVKNLGTYQRRKLLDTIRIKTENYFKGLDNFFELSKSQNINTFQINL